MKDAIDAATHHAFFPSKRSFIERINNNIRSSIKKCNMINQMLPISPLPSTPHPPFTRAPSGGGGIIPPRGEGGIKSRDSKHYLRLCFDSLAAALLLLLPLLLSLLLPLLLLVLTGLLSYTTLINAFITTTATCIRISWSMTSTAAIGIHIRWSITTAAVLLSPFVSANPLQVLLSSLVCDDCSRADLM